MSEFIIVAFVYFATVFKLVTYNEVNILAKFAQNIALPALLFINISTSDLSDVLRANLLLSFYLPVIICFSLRTLGGYYFFLNSFSNSIPIGFCLLFSNSLLFWNPHYRISSWHRSIKIKFCYCGISTRVISIKTIDN